MIIILSKILQEFIFEIWVRTRDVIHTLLLCRIHPEFEPTNEPKPKEGVRWAVRPMKREICRKWKLRGHIWWGPPT